MNKIQIKLVIGFLIVIFGIFFFIFISGKSSDNSSFNSEKTINVSNSTLPSKSEEEIKKDQEQKEIEYAENIKTQNEIFNEAIDNFDVSLCENITDAKLKQDCLDNVYLGLSKEKNEISYCMKIQSEEKIISCKNLMYYDLAIKNNSQAFCNKIKADDSLIKSCNTNVVFATLETKDLQGDTKICDTLTGSDKEYCLNRIKKADDLETLRDAVEGNNSGDCSNIHDKNLKNNCSDVITIDKAINEQNISLCENIISTEKKTQCKTTLGKIQGEDLLKEAIEKNDINLCNKITDVTLKMTCNDNIYMKKAYSEKNISLCDKIQKENTQTQCKNDLHLILKQK